MLLAHLLASPFFGGPERQVLGLARHLPSDVRSVFLTFSEGDRASALLDRVREAGFEGISLRHNWPHWRRCATEIAEHLQQHKVDLLCTNGYKPNLLGYLAGRRAGVPVVAIAHGWTSASWKVKLNETLDRAMLRRFDCVVSVSRAQAGRVARAGVPAHRMVTIPNALALEDVPRSSGEDRDELARYFAAPPRHLVVAAGRLSPEKGFSVLIEAADRLQSVPDVGFVIFGDGPLRDSLAEQIASAGLQSRVVLGGFRSDVTRLLGAADVVALSSYTEGLPVVLLEAMAAEVPVLATSVGGVPEVVRDNIDGLLVPPGDPRLLADGIQRLLADVALRRRLAAAGRARVQTDFTCAQQAERYAELFYRLVACSTPASQRCPRSEPQAV